MGTFVSGARRPPSGQLIADGGHACSLLSSSPSLSSWHFNIEAINDLVSEADPASCQYTEATVYV